MKRLLPLLLLLFLCGCDEESMDHQNRLSTYGEAKDLSFWPAEGEALRLVEGTVARGALKREEKVSEPPPVSLALLKRGRERYDIYCAACHGLTGAGNGIVVKRGFPEPKPLYADILLSAPAKHFVDVISNGTGRMYAFSDRVDPVDRWAITAYIRALQLAATKKAGR